MDTPLLREETRDGVTTLTFSQPARLNGWTAPLLAELLGALHRLNHAPDTRVLILTGEGRYYSAGVNLGGTLRLDHPRTLHQFIVTHNQSIFDHFLDFDKPIVAAVNGPAIGAPVTSATLCDTILASDRATFSTPFARLGVTAEGCSSVLFGRLMGDDTAQRMLGPEGWTPSATEAAEAGLIDRVVSHDALMDEAYALARKWIAEGRTRQFRGGMTRAALKAINADESQRLADAFLSPPFLRGQMKFLWSKKKFGPATLFTGLWATRPLWRLLL